MRPRRTSQLFGFLAFGLLAAFAAGLTLWLAAPVDPAPGLPTLPARRLPWLAWGMVAVALAAAVAGVLGYRAWAAAAELDAVARAMTGGEPRLAADLVTRYGCGGCHTVPGLPGADGLVAAPLVQLALPRIRRRRAA